MTSNRVITIKDTVKHSTTGASSAHRWMACPRSVALLAKVYANNPKKGTNPAAAEGTAAHHIGAECLLRDMEAWEFAGHEIKVAGYTFECNEEMVNGVQLWLDYVRDILKENPKAKLFVEKSLGPSKDDEGAFGTSDTIIYIPGKRLIIIDFKYGRGITVEPDSAQNKYYGYLAVETLIGKEKKSLPIHLGIVQPRIPHPKGLVRIYETTKGEIEKWWKGEVVPALKATKDENATLQIGSHCTFCDAKLTCPAHKKETIEMSKNENAEHLTDGELTTIMQKKDAVKAFIESVEKEAFKRMLAGTKLEGFKLVKKRAIRKWKERVVLGDEEMSIEEALVKEFGEDKIYAPRKILTPPAVEKLTGGKSFTQEYAFTPEGGATIAPDKDARTEIKPLVEMGVANGV